MAKKKEVQEIDQILQLREEYAPLINVGDLIDEFNMLKRARLETENRWSMLENEIYPRGAEVTDYSSTSIPSGSIADTTVSYGEKNYSGVILSIINRIVSQLFSLIANPANMWLGLDMHNPLTIMLPKNQMIQFDPAKSICVSKWLGDITRLLLKKFSDPGSNFYQSFFEVIFGCFSMGCSCRDVVQKNDGSLLFRNHKIKHVYVDVNSLGEVNRLFRSIVMNGRQAMEMYGQYLSPQLLARISGKSKIDSSLKVRLLEVNIPNPYRDRLPGQPYIQITIEEESRHIVLISFSNTMSYVFSRINSHGNHLYGSSYVLDSLTTIRAINQMNEMILDAVLMAARKPIIVKNAASLIPQDVFPRAILPLMDAQGNASIAPLNLGADSNTIVAMMQYLQSLIMELENALIIRDSTQPENVEQTATAINIRNLQNHYRTIPFIAKFEQEDLRSIIVNTLQLLFPSGIGTSFPYMELSKEIRVDPKYLVASIPDPINLLKISFKGQLTKTQRINDAINSEMVLNKAAQINQLISQNVKYIFNAERFIANEVRAYDLPLDILTTDDERKDLAEADRQQMEAQQAVQMATAENLSMEAMERKINIAKIRQESGM